MLTILLFLIVSQICKPCSVVLHNRHQSTNRWWQQIQAFIGGGKVVRTLGSPEVLFQKAFKNYTNKCLFKGNER